MALKRYANHLYQKGFKMWKTILLPIVIAALLTGCVQSVQPLYTDVDLIFDKELLGTWTWATGHATREPVGPLDLSTPVEIPIIHRHWWTRDKKANLHLGKDFFEFREQPPSHNFRISPEKVIRLKSDSYFRIFGNFLEWFFYFLIFEDFPDQGYTIHFSEKTKAGKHIRIWVDASSVEILRKYLKQNSPNLEVLDFSFDLDLTVEKSGDKAYALTLPSTKFELHLMRLGESLFVDIYPTHDEEEAARKHTFLRIERDGDAWHTWFLDRKWLKGKTESGEAKLEHESEDGTIILKASTHELRAFFLKYAEDEEAFSGPLEWRRQKVE